METNAIVMPDTIGGASGAIKLNPNLAGNSNNNGANPNGNTKTKSACCWVWIEDSSDSIVKLNGEGYQITN